VKDVNSRISKVAREEGRFRGKLAIVYAFCILTPTAITRPVTYQELFLHLEYHVMG